ncbi:lysophospholipid acyltransferase family protein [Streptomyces sp. NBC_01217]|uniref:lysophospholipid acyltransferase family protein n=1 Tax=Streptomyces sp. NBC_01217 TaxID=2903779 RepID=UPI002E15602E|nr:1-acyl-sn-glycerol-3-phosphate acyltransferase [Streptomyces sp. NBC_01217]
MNPWAVEALCTPRCATDAGPRVPLSVTARRYASLATTLLRSVADGERLSGPATLRRRAEAALTDLGIRLERAPCAEPLTAPGPVGTLVVANHISWLDVVALLAVEPELTLLAKREVGTWPVVGALARRIGTRFIDREGLRQLPGVVADLADTLRSGRSVVVFPQATTWCTVAGGSFRRATFQAAINAGAPVRPVTIDYLQHGRPSTVAAFLGDEDFGTCLRRVAGARALSVRVTMHRPLAGTDRRTLAAMAQQAVSGSELPNHV